MIQTIGIVVALESEIQPFLQKHPPIQSILTTPFVFHKIEYQGIHWILVFSGMGKDNARSATQILIQNYHPDFILNPGYCGYTGDSRNLPSRLFIPEKIIDLDSQFQPQKEYLSNRAKWMGLTNNNYPSNKMLLCANDVVSTREEKAQLDKAYPDSLIDMESCAVAQIAEEYQIPFMTLRIIMDDNQRDLNINFSKLLGKDRKIRIGAVLKDMLCHPSHLEEYLFLGKSNRTLAQELSRTLEDLVKSI